MGNHDDGPGRDASPYSRTGLFPWGSTYDVPVRWNGTTFTTHTPCHLRPVEIAPDDATDPRRVQCPACGRAWTVRVATGTRPRAIWTA